MLPIIHLDRTLQGAGLMGWKGTVEFRADLPITLGTPAIGDIYLVEKKTTLLGFTTYQSGLYIRDTNVGALSDWRRLNIKVHFTDGEFALVSGADNTKKGVYDMSLVTTGTTRTYKHQNKNGTIAHLSDIGTLSGAWIMTARVTPAALIAHTHDWAITNLKDYSVIFASTSGANYDLTGIDSTGIVDGQTFFFYNTGASGDIKLKNNNAGSLAANRFMTNGDVIVKDGMGVVLTYDTTASRWRVNYYK